MAEPPDEPPAAPAIRCVGVEYLHTHRTGRLRRDSLVLPSGTVRTITYTESHGAVYVVPLTAAGEIVLIRQYRYCVGAWLWEVPAGAIFEGDHDRAALAAAELAEEIGAVADQLLDLGWFYDAAPVSTSRCHVYLAVGTRLTLAPSRGEMELIEPRRVPAADALDWARGGRLLDGRSALALLLAERAVLARR